MLDFLSFWSCQEIYLIKEQVQLNLMRSIKLFVVWGQVMVFKQQKILFVLEENLDLEKGFS